MTDHVPRLCPLCGGPLQRGRRAPHWPYGIWHRCTRCQSPEGYRTYRGQVAALRQVFERMIAEGRIVHLRAAAGRR